MLARMSLGSSWFILEEQGGHTGIFEVEEQIEKLCLPGQLEYLPNTANIAQAIPSSPHVYGAEYEYSVGPNSNTFQHNVPCAV